MTHPPHYRGPHDPGRDPNLVMSDLVAQNLIADIVALHDELCRKLDHDVDVAAQGAPEPASGYVTGSGEHDQMITIAAAIKQAERERERALKNAQQELRRTKQYYQERLGLIPPRRPRVESIDYLDGGQRKVG